ncbi:MAG: EAL domain-containing protein [Campylobacterota bacterium]|nr:EAL domain-containing protein [Campylobacterota bacterium]
MINDTIVSIIANQTISTEYQPIISIDNRTIYAYEALARFQVDGVNIAPNEVFSLCHEDPDVLFLLESMVKQKQLLNRPKDAKLFINLDPDSFTKSHYKTFWVELLQEQSDIVVEIIENSEEENIVEISNFIDFLDQESIIYAMDDFAQDGSIYSSDFLLRAPIIKLDMGFLENVKKFPPYAEVLRGFTNFIKRTNKLGILEGVETEDDFKIAKELGVEYVQGYLFKEHFL